VEVLLNITETVSDVVDDVTNVAKSVTNVDTDFCEACKNDEFISDIVDGIEKDIICKLITGLGCKTTRRSNIFERSEQRRLF
jgi:hypothetical protein